MYAYATSFTIAGRRYESGLYGQEKPIDSVLSNYQLTLLAPYVQVDYLVFKIGGIQVFHVTRVLDYFDN